MAYFLPSYFQKRLLRYALNRLDFIDTGKLDLDNLGLTFGQRSVIELKDVAIKTNKLVETIPLPPSLVLEQASIHLLRLTVPADLHVSGIEVEVDGIKIHARIIDEEPEQVHSKPQDKSRFGLSHTDSANRPRISSPSIHDPGGRLNSSRHGGHLELSQVIPSSQDLALSFLESEPLEERQELEAVIEQQSHDVQASVMSSSFGEESGLGMPGGLTLPGFVANFFKGVADRLKFKVSNVEITIGMELPSALPREKDSVTFMLRLESFAVDGLESSNTDDPNKQLSRVMHLQAFDFGILTERDSISTVNSPKLVRSQKSLSRSTSDTSDEARLDLKASMSASEYGSGEQLPQNNSDLELANSSFDFQPTVGLAIESSSAESANSSPLLSPSVMYDQDGNTEIDNKAFAENQLGNASVLHSQVREPSPQSDVEGLSESKIFTHDDAESMYMSAVSNEPVGSSTRAVMPGGWTWSEAVEKQKDHVNPIDAVSESRTSSDTPTHPQAPEYSVASEHFTEPTKAETATLDTQREANVKPEPSHMEFTRLISLNNLSIRLPDSLTQATSTQEPSASSHSSRGTISGTQKSGPVTHGIDVSTSSIQHRQSPASKLRGQAYGETPIEKTTLPQRAGIMELEAGKLIVDMDMNMSKVFVRVAQSLLSRISTSDSGTQIRSQKQSTKPSIQISLSAAELRFWETISKAASSMPTGLPGATTVVDEPLLLLSLLSVKISSEGLPVSAQRLTIGKVSLHHSSREVISFIDSVNVRDSISSSSILRPHDVTVAATGGRVDIQIKPIHIVLDLPILDDVLSRSGGLSSLLDLGNSIGSTNTIKAVAPGPVPNTQSQRTVRFDAPDKRSRSDSDASGSKINLRLSGSVIDLVGSAATVQLKTSAIKVVSRQDNIRIVIDGAAIEGPILPRASNPPAIFMKMKSIEFHFSLFPVESDLDRLLSLLTPSNDKYDKDDDIMVDTLLRQRRKGSVLKLTLGEIQLGAHGLDWQSQIASIADELAKLSSVTKYLPEDDRPGILIFALINKIDCRFHVDDLFGPIHLKAELLEGANISVPSLAAAQISFWSVSRGDKDILIGEVTSQENTVMGPPMLMCRFIADEMDPTVRLKLTNTCLEYKVATLVAISEFIDRLKSGKVDKPDILSHVSSPISSSSSDDSNFARKVKLSVALRDSAIGLHPTDNPAKGLFLLTDTVIDYSTRKRDSTLLLDLKKASLMIIDDIQEREKDSANIDHKLYFDQNDQVQELAKIGFIPIIFISSASAVVKVFQDEITHDQQIDVEFRNNLLLMETCADSTQTLVQILNGLAPPTPPSMAEKYRTQIVPITDMLASFTGNAFVSEPGAELGLQTSQITTTTAGAEDEDDDEYGGYLDDFDPEEGEDEAGNNMTASYVESELSQSTTTGSLHIAPVQVNAPGASDLGSSMMAHSMLDFRTDHFSTKSPVGGTAHRWDSTKNTYDLGSNTVIQKSPLKVRVRDMHVIWNLFDGYDWQSTRDTISQAVKQIETKAMNRRPRSNSRLSPAVEEDDESVIGDFLFNSIYIGIPANKDPKDLASAINHDIDDLVSETGSYATGTTITASPTRRQSGRSRPKGLKLSRSKQHKMTFELEGVSADIITFPPGSGEVESSVDVRVRKLEVFDHIPTSTWKKFATYMQDAGEREVDTNMIHLELLNVKPIPDLAASEIVLKITALPLRLHVDQDALDFMSRFFEFKDDKVPAPSTPSVPPFIQRVEVNPVQIKLDFKPKRVDYGGIRSGRTTEFMNFFVLDRAEMTLRRVILYGVSGFDRVGLMLNDIWSPDVRKNQLPRVLAGLAPIRPLVDVTSGVRDLITVPIREYKKDGRVVRSIQKGAIAFAKTTATELVNLGAKLAIGTQQVLQNAEDILVQNPERDQEGDDEVKHQISLYADQPLGIVQGLRGAYASLERDLLLARDAIVAVPGEVMASGSATGAARAVLRQSPVIILRPAIGASKAVGQTLLGAGNTLDRKNLRRVEEKYKRH